MLKHITTEQLTLSLADIEQQITQRKALISQAQASITKLERIQKNINDLIHTMNDEASIQGDLSELIDLSNVS